MRKRLSIYFWLAAAVLMISAPTFAHHGSIVSYDINKIVTMEGTVTEFQFTNPHAQILFDVKREDGKTERWIAETNSATALYRLGWKKDTLKPGAQITAIGWRSRNATTTMHLHKVMLADQEIPMER